MCPYFIMCQFLNVAYVLKRSYEVYLILQFNRPVIRCLAIHSNKDKTQERLPEGIGNAYRQRSTRIIRARKLTKVAQTIFL